MNTNDNLETPPYIFKWLNSEFNFDVDCCADDNNTKCSFYFTEEKSFLDINNNNLVHSVLDETTLNESGTVSLFCNPPYSDPLPFVKKITDIINADHIFKFKAVMLLKLDTSPKWFNLCLQNASEIRMITGGRIKFFKNGEETKGGSICSMIAIFKPNILTNCMINTYDINEIKKIYG